MTVPANILAAASFAFQTEKIRALVHGEDFEIVKGIEKAIEAAFEMVGFSQDGKK